jgi:DNA topoisomerase-1
MALAMPEPWQPPAAAGAAELVDPVESARAAGLRYVSELTPGIRRTRAGKGFGYTGSDGRPIDAETPERLLALLSAQATAPASERRAASTAR